MALIEHTKEVIAVGFGGQLCISIAQDKQVVIYRLDLYYKQNKMIFKEETNKIANDSLVAVKHNEKIGNQKEQAYFAISSGIKFAVW